MDAITVFELPCPPSVNHYWRRVGARTIISREGRDYLRTVCGLLAAAGAEERCGPLEVKVEVYPPDRRRRDVDNVLKALLDAMEKGGAYRDDGQIVRLVAEKHEPVEDGRAIVKIRERPEWNDSSRRA